MLVALSPYHLTTREPVAMAALLLAERVVTLLPRTGQGREGAEEAAERLPRYLDLMLSWRWSQPLWEAGVICSSLDGSEAAADVREAHARIVGEERFSRLRGLMRPELLDTEERYLDAVAADLLKGGPDPAITVPLAAGIDQFAMRHGAAVARSSPFSIAQKAEATLGDRAFAFVIPVLLQASAERMLEAREELESELASLRDAINEEVMSRPARRVRGGSERLAEAVAAYSDAFERKRESLTEADEDGIRVIEGAVSVTGLMLPADAVLTSSLAALDVVKTGRAEAAVDAPAQPGSLDRPRFLALVVKVLGRVPASQR